MRCWLSARRSVLTLIRMIDGQWASSRTGSLGASCSTLTVKNIYQFADEFRNGFLKWRDISLSQSSITLFCSRQGYHAQRVYLSPNIKRDFFWLLTGIWVSPFLLSGHGQSSGRLESNQAFCTFRWLYIQPFSSLFLLHLHNLNVNLREVRKVILTSSAYFSNRIICAIEYWRNVFVYGIAFSILNLNSLGTFKHFSPCCCPFPLLQMSTDYPATSPLNSAKFVIRVVFFSFLCHLAFCAVTMCSDNNNTFIHDALFWREHALLLRPEILRKRFFGGLCLASSQVHSNLKLHTSITRDEEVNEYYMVDT